MLGPYENATFVPAEPPRRSTLAIWPDHSGAGTDVQLVLPRRDGVGLRTVRAELVPVADLLDHLAGLAPDADVSRSVQAWAHVTRVALALIARGRLHPGAVDDVDCWRLGPLSPDDRSVRAALAAWLPPEAHATPQRGHTPPRMAAAVVAVAGFYDAVADVLPRTAAAPLLARHWAFAEQGVTRGAGIGALVPDESSDRAVVGLRLLLPEGDGPFSVRLQVRSALDPSILADVADLWAGTAAGFGPEAEADLLVAIRRGARVWPPLQPLLAEATPTVLELDDDDAISLLGPVANQLGTVGIEVLAPATLAKTLTATAHVEPPPGAGDAGSRFDLSTLCELTYRPTLDGEPLTPAELSELAASRRPLVKLRDEWVLVDPTVVAKLTRRDVIAAGDAVAAALGGEVRVGGERMVVEAGPVFADIASRLRRAVSPHELPEPEGLQTELRPYQRRGLAWMSEMADLGFGGILADDMGLGKTVQLIALHLARVARGDLSPALVVCPATLVSNWQHEVARFAPSIDVLRYHGTDRTLDSVDGPVVVVTTYGIVRRDHELLAKIDWGLVVADEAQQIKNPNASVSRAMRSLTADARLALTGTPVENRLTELWSLLDWTTPGLLGNVESFRRDLAIPIERDHQPEATARLSRLVAPFVLRRRKLDPDVAPDLPPKIETDHLVTLTAEQAGLYRAVVEESLDKIRMAEGMARRGLVLRLLTALKQICNHPAHYLGQPGPLPGRSGKLAAFDDLVPAIVDAGDATLVFTQYVKMGDLLVTHLEAQGIDTRFLHGSLTLGKRAAMVDEFQAGGFPVFVISLKAGGTGLNLTKATHVIHYDRWWNPAVEDQASDRAWRIGQDRTVQIHRPISEGTVEERIAVVLAEKAALADAVIGGGEAWISELSDSDLADLVRLGAA